MGRREKQRPAELTPEEKARVRKQLHRTFKRPEEEHDDEGVHRIGPDLALYVPRHERQKPVRIIEGYGEDG